MPGLHLNIHSLKCALGDQHPSVKLAQAADAVPGVARRFARTQNNGFLETKETAKAQWTNFQVDHQSNKQSAELLKNLARAPHSAEVAFLEVSPEQWRGEAKTVAGIDEIHIGSIKDPYLMGDAVQIGKRYGEVTSLSRKLLDRASLDDTLPRKLHGALVTLRAQLQDARIERSEPKAFTTHGSVDSMRIEADFAPHKSGKGHTGWVADLRLYVGIPHALVNLYRSQSHGSILANDGGIHSFVYRADENGVVDARGIMASDRSGRSHFSLGLSVHDGETGKAKHSVEIALLGAY